MFIRLKFNDVFLSEICYILVYMYAYTGTIIVRIYPTILYVGRKIERDANNNRKLANLR